MGDYYRFVRYTQTTNSWPKDRVDTGWYIEIFCKLSSHSYHLMAQKKDMGATKLWREYSTTRTGRIAYANRQQWPFEYHSWESRSKIFIHPKGKVWSSGYENRAKRWHELDEHVEQCDEGCDIWQSDRRYWEPSCECQRELEYKSCHALSKAY